MSRDQLKKFAKQFIDDQKRILEEHGDKVIHSKYKEAIDSAQKTFEAISAKPNTLAAKKSA